MEFNLGRNRFSGPIPSQIGSLKYLFNLDFSRNKLSGPFTPEISQCKILAFVNLCQNEFTGEIPNEIMAMETWCCWTSRETI